MNINTDLKKFTIDKYATRHRDLMHQIMNLAGEDPEDIKLYRKWCGQTSGISYEKIQDMILTAKREGKKPIALFRYLLKQHKK